MENYIGALKEHHIEGGLCDMVGLKNLYHIPSKYEVALLETYHIPMYFDKLIEELAVKVDELFYNECNSPLLGQHERKYIDTGWCFNIRIGKAFKKKAVDKFEYKIIIRTDYSVDGAYTFAIDDELDSRYKRQIIVCVNIFFIGVHYGLGTPKGLDFTEYNRNRCIDYFKEQLKHEFLHATERFFNLEGKDPVKNDRNSKYFTLEDNETNDLMNPDKIPYNLDAVNKFFYYFSDTEMNARLSELYQHLDSLNGKYKTENTDFLTLKNIERDNTEITRIDFMYKWKDSFEREMYSNEVDPTISYIVLANQRIGRFKHIKDIGYTIDNVKSGQYSERSIVLYHKQIQKIYDELNTICQNYMNKIMKTIFSVLKGKEYFKGSPLEEAEKIYTENLIFDYVQYPILEKLDIRRRYPYNVFMM